MKCPKCRGELKPGIALINTAQRGLPDFGDEDENESRGQTFSYTGPPRIIQCHKCEDCGWSKMIKTFKEKSDGLA